MLQSNEKIHQRVNYGQEKFVSLTCGKKTLISKKSLSTRHFISYRMYIKIQQDRILGHNITNLNKSPNFKLQPLDN